MTTIKTVEQFKEHIRPNTSFWYLVYDNNQPVKIEKATVKEYINDEEISLKDGFFADFKINPEIKGFLIETPVYLKKDSATKKLQSLTKK
ncbi:hypothetical protein HC766_03530 [Candidatus Gracilibacteria bacterium]|nr:hypothetical protein [Candidatus Gracilibacteria bacterium]NJS41416.1 hypothetical protein [Candidatus Gracilibacteria bacterium]